MLMLLKHRESCLETDSSEPCLLSYWSCYFPANYTPAICSSQLALVNLAYILGCGCCFLWILIQNTSVLPRGLWFTSDDQSRSFFLCTKKTWIYFLTASWFVCDKTNIRNNLCFYQGGEVKATGVLPSASSSISTQLDSSKQLNQGGCHLGNNTSAAGWFPGWNSSADRFWLPGLTFTCFVTDCRVECSWLEMSMILSETVFYFEVFPTFIPSDGSHIVDQEPVQPTQKSQIYSKYISDVKKAIGLDKSNRLFQAIQNYKKTDNYEDLVAIVVSLLTEKNEDFTLLDSKFFNILEPFSL